METRKTIIWDRIAEMDLSGPYPDAEGDLYRSLDGIEILIPHQGDGTDLRLRLDGQEAPNVLDEDGEPMDPERLSALLWERLEAFDEVIERLAGPLPAP